MRHGLLSIARHAAANLRRRAALGLRPVTAPVIVFIPLGFALGPGGVGVLSHDALGYLDVVVSIALATLGVFMGLAAGAETRHVRRLFAASTAEALVTVGIVSGAMLFLLRAWDVPLVLSARLPPQRRTWKAPATRSARSPREWRTWTTSCRSCSAASSL